MACVAPLLLDEPVGAGEHRDIKMEAKRQEFYDHAQDSKEYLYINVTEIKDSCLHKGSYNC